MPGGAEKFPAETVQVVEIVNLREPVLDFDMRRVSAGGRE